MDICYSILHKKKLQDFFAKFIFRTIKVDERRMYQDFHKQNQA